MADKKQQEFVKEITPMEVDFSQWYTDVILKTDMVDYAPVKGCMVIKPYGYGVWEGIQRVADRRFKATAVSYTHLRAHETPEHLVCRLLLEKKKKHHTSTNHVTHTDTTHTSNNK